MQQNINKYRQKLLEMIVFFSQKRKIKYPSKLMMFKLLAESDFRHFEETGLPITNLKHIAFTWGPVAESLQKEITEGDELILPNDFQDSLMVEKNLYTNVVGEKRVMFKYIAKRKANLNIFSPRQIRIMEEVADIYKIADPTEASKASHEPNKPWTRAVKAKGEKAKIDYIEFVPLRKPLTADLAKEMLREREAFIYNYGE